MGREGNLVEVPYKELPASYKKYIRVEHDSGGEEIFISSLYGDTRIRWIDGKVHVLVPSERIPFWKLKEFGGYL